MPISTVARYWFMFGNYDAWLGRRDDPLISIGKAEPFYRAGHAAGRMGRFYRKHFFS